VVLEGFVVCLSLSERLLSFYTPVVRHNFHQYLHSRIFINKMCPIQFRQATLDLSIANSDSGVTQVPPRIIQPFLDSGNSSCIDLHLKLYLA